MATTKKKSKLKELVIKRKNWVNGDVLAKEEKVDPDNAHGSSLRRIDGKQCCLGFYAKQIGFTNTQILNVGTPCSLIRNSSNANGRKFTELSGKLIKESHWGYEDNRLCDQLVAVNDRLPKGKYKDPKYRETRIAKLFKEIDVKVTFV